jgi:hypothetical protein
MLKSFYVVRRCWIRAIDNQLNKWTWLLFFFPTLILFLSSLIVGIYVHRNLHNTAVSNSFSSSTRDRTLSFSRVYIFFFGIYWFLVGLVYFLNYSTKFDYWVISGLVVFGIGSRGVVDALLWAYFHGTLHHLLRLSDSGDQLTHLVSFFFFFFFSRVNR